MKYIVDTHALIWFLEGNPRLGAGAKTILSDAKSQLVLPAIALAEAIWIIGRGRTSIPSIEALLNAVKSDPRIVVYPLNQGVIEQSVTLSTIGEMHDRQIVATALLLQIQSEAVTLLTCDQNITASGLVSVIW
ncbi:MAG: type II toxin-antitoxin system VapC family toxin [Thermosynechococcaceae cyanobacterium]